MRIVVDMDPRCCALEAVYVVLQYSIASAGHVQPFRVLGNGLAAPYSTWIDGGK